MLDKIREIIEEHPELADFGEPQAESTIAAAEARLGVRFPKSFCEYLMRWGWLCFGPLEYQGLGTTTQNVVMTTERVRRIRELPRYLVIVSDHDGDEYVCLDTSRFDGFECPAIVWDSPTKSISRHRSDDFSSFLESDIQGFIS